MRPQHSFKLYSLLLSCGMLLTTTSLEASASGKASNTNQIETPREFDFSSHRNLTFDISVINDDRSPVSNVKIKIYTLDNGEFGSGKKRQILYGRTQEDGWMKRQLDIPAEIPLLLVEVDNQGSIEQKTISVGSDDYIHLNF